MLRASPELLDQFKWDKVGRPTCLGAVILELAMSRRFISAQEYLSSITPIQPSTSAKSDVPGWPRWVASNLLGKPLWWAMKQMSIVDEEDNDAESRRKSSAQAWKEAQRDWVVLQAVQVRFGLYTFGLRL